ncbi:hypothetical protein K5I29_02845 [Flavobacterium agricola]|uniref:Uncharacterized protein n=1 Tax=Flavobacterium agricola TaxID=2870839 RepID=A0ABY6M3C4_9FLAO|nr:hypothetical protein [Flavobacterium agricola]UYW01873.1 hypothetical protein K5I29_02845 [Flavobacterium agricola]
MNTSKIIEIIMYCLPALLTGGVAYYFFKMHVDNEENRRRYHLLKSTQKDVLPLKLQAYERMTIFLERTNPAKLVLRISPMDQNPTNYANMLIQTIENEFEHNLAQQIYMSPEAWQIISKSKHAIISNFRHLSTKVETADELRTLILTNIATENETSTNLALLYIKNEVSQLIG